MTPIQELQRSRSAIQNSGQPSAEDQPRDGTLHLYVQAQVDVRFTARTVQVFLRGELIATHRRGSGNGNGNGKQTTPPDHMHPVIVAMPRGPSSAWPPGGRDRAVGQHPVHADPGAPPASRAAFRACLGILRLARSSPDGRLEAAAAHAIEIGALTYGSVQSILDNKLDRLAAEPRSAEHQPIRHRNS